MIHRYCVSHQKPLLPDSWYDRCIALGNFQPNSALHVRQLDPYWDDVRPIAYGAAGSYVLPIAVERFSGDAEFIEVSSFRKRILSSPEGREAKIFPTLRELTLTGVSEIPDRSLSVRPGFDFLIAHPIYFKKTVFGHYAAIHHRRDFLDYVSVALELGVLDATSASEFMTAKHFIPGGIELGTYPKDWLMRELSQLELVSRLFLNYHGDRISRYNKYQIRAVGFLSERLGSFILLRHLMDRYSNHIPAEIFGHMTVIVEDDSPYSAGIADQHKNRRDRYHLKMGRRQ